MTVLLTGPASAAVARNCSSGGSTVASAVSASAVVASVVAYYVEAAVYKAGEFHGLSASVALAMATEAVPTAVSTVLGGVKVEMSVCDMAPSVPTTMIVGTAGPLPSLLMPWGLALAAHPNLEGVGVVSLITVVSVVSMSASFIPMISVLGFIPIVG